MIETAMPSEALLGESGQSSGHLALKVPGQEEFQAGISTLPALQGVFITRLTPQDRSGNQCLQCIALIPVEYFALHLHL